MGVELMQLPVFKAFPNRRETYDLYRQPQMLTVFGGYDRRPKAQEGTWYDQLNMSAEQYPAMSTRRKRKVVQINNTTLTSTAGIIDKDAIITINGTKVVIGSNEYDLGLSTADADCPKQLVSMGAYLIIWPDGKYINTKKPISDSGSINNTYTPGLADDIRVKLCNENGTVFPAYTYGGTAPQEPADGDLWLDNSGDEPVMKQWSSTRSMWAIIPTYLKIVSTPSALSDAHIGDGFKAGDAVKITNAPGLDDSQLHIIKKRGTNYIVVPGILNVSDPSLGMIINPTAFRVIRKAPKMDFICECGNRLWGCRYGEDNDGNDVNEIYASKLGDFKNWNYFAGSSMDSYAAGRGTDGVFTGAITHQGHPLFFRENSFERVYPSANGAHQIVTVEGRGVQDGCWRSLAIVDEVLFYKSRHAVCAYSGSLPVDISEALGDNYYDDARAGAAGNTYYISMRNTSDNTWHFFTYDLEHRIWNREDDMKVLMFAKRQGRIYYVNETNGNVVRYYTQTEAQDDPSIEWSVTSNVIGLDLAENEYISRFVIRCETIGNVHLEIRYDEETETVNNVEVEKWHDKGTVSMSGLGSFVLPVTPRRCDHLRFRLSGDYPIRIYSITKHVQTGSDVHWRRET